MGKKGVPDAIQLLLRNTENSGGSRGIFARVAAGRLKIKERVRWIPGSGKNIPGINRLTKNWPGSSAWILKPFESIWIRRNRERTIPSPER